MLYAENGKHSPAFTPATGNFSGVILQGTEQARAHDRLFAKTGMRFSAKKTWLLLYNCYSILNQSGSPHFWKNLMRTSPEKKGFLFWTLATIAVSILKAGAASGFLTSGQLSPDLPLSYFSKAIGQPESQRDNQSLQRDNQSLQRDNQSLQRDNQSLPVSMS